MNNPYKKHTLIFMSLCLGVCLALLLSISSCNKEDALDDVQLDVPTTMLSANSLGADRFGIYWSTVTGADSYEVQLNGQMITSTEATSYLFTGLTEATLYIAGVRAVSGTNVSDWSELSVRTYNKDQVVQLASPVLSAPTGSISQNAFTVVWDAVENASRYSWSLNDGEIRSTQELQVTCSGLTAGTSYTIRVRAEADAGNFAASEWASLQIRTATESAGEDDIPAGYRLVWSDEFNAETLDQTIWNIEVNGNGGGNNELQYYCEQGVSIGLEPESQSRCLILTATRESYQGKQFTSGRVNTLGKYSFTYGRLDARIRMPQTANGLWPAFWLMGDDFDEKGWPACGETDIVEMGHANGIANGTQDRFFNGACHWGPAWNNKGDYALDTTAPYSMQDGFHLYTCIWDENEIAMYYDLDRNPSQQPYFRMNITRTAGYENSELHVGNYFHKPNFIIFNLAVGGNFPSIFNANDITALNNGPASMYVDYVRLYEKE